jgi:hypothetical protein
MVFSPFNAATRAQANETRQSLKIYSRIALADAQKEYQAVIRAVPPSDDKRD